MVGGLTLVTASALLLAGCAAAPEEDTDTTDAASDFIPCMVSDAGGFDDKSFNQLGKEGIDKAAAELGVEPILVESAAETDYTSNIQSLIDQDCSLIVTVGFALSTATVEAALANPEVEFAIIDDAADNDFDGKTDAPYPMTLLIAKVLGYQHSSGHQFYKGCRTKDSCDLLGMASLTLLGGPLAIYLSIQLYPVVLAAGLLYAIAHTARFARRHKKLFDEHVKDPEAHK